MSTTTTNQAATRRPTRKRHRFGIPPQRYACFLLAVLQCVLVSILVVQSNTPTTILYQTPTMRQARHDLRTSFVVLQQQQVPNNTTATNKTATVNGRAFNPISRKNNNNSYNSSSSVNKTFPPVNDKTSPDPMMIPVVVLSALRPDYLNLTLQALIRQHPHTPRALLQSPRYLFLHKHELSNVEDRWNRTLAVAADYPQFTVHVFDELYSGRYPPKHFLVAYHAKYTWYHMMHYLFHSLNITTDVLLVEEDVVLAHDALLTAAALLRHKASRHDVHNIALGGWSGENRINPHPNTFLAVRSPAVQPMAYSLNRTLFDAWHAALQRQEILDFESNTTVHDWSEEVVSRNFCQNYTLLTPSVSRMHHIGIQGMGATGNATVRRPIYPRAWAPWTATMTQVNRTMDEYRLEPLEITDVFGFLCTPIQSKCNATRANTVFPVKERFGNVRINNRRMDTGPLSPNVVRQQ